MRILYGVIGAGGYGREVMPLARMLLASELGSGKAELVFVVEGEPLDNHVNGVLVISLSDFLTFKGAKRFNIAISDSKVRLRLASLCVNSDALPFNIVAPNSFIMDKNEIGEGLLLSPFTTVTSNAKIGRFFQANIYSYVAHDCVIGDFVTFAPTVSCNGNVVVGDHAYIGTGAIIKQGSKDRPLLIGEGAVVGMGAVVTKNVEAYTTVVGNPARPLIKK